MVKQYWSNTVLVKQAIEQARETISPGIVIIGNDFYIEVEETEIRVQNANLQKTLAYLIALNYIYLIYNIPHH